MGVPAGQTSAVGGMSAAEGPSRATTRCARTASAARSLTKSLAGRRHLVAFRTLPAGMSGIPTNIAATIGHTPVLQLSRLLGDDSAAELFVKLEAFNPGGSVKDRIGAAMIEAAETRGPDRAGSDDGRRGDQR